jgi:hypothetical protein
MHQTCMTISWQKTNKSDIIWLYTIFTHLSKISLPHPCIAHPLSMVVQVTTLWDGNFLNTLQSSFMLLQFAHMSTKLPPTKTSDLKPLWMICWWTHLAHFNHNHTGICIQYPHKSNRVWSHTSCCICWNSSSAFCPSLHSHVPLSESHPHSMIWWWTQLASSSATTLAHAFNTTFSMLHLPTFSSLILPSIQWKGPKRTSAQFRPRQDSNQERASKLTSTRELWLHWHVNSDRIDVQVLSLICDPTIVKELLAKFLSLTSRDCRKTSFRIMYFWSHRSHGEALHLAQIVSNLLIWMWRYHYDQVKTFQQTNTRTVRTRQ